jgi:hypothetical protein
MRSHRWFANGTAVLLAACSLWIASAASAELLLIDDFNDGNDDGWTRYDYTQSDPWGPGSFDASSGRYALETQGTVTGEFKGLLTAVWDASENPFFSNGYLRATARSNAPQSNPWLALRTGVGDDDPFYAFGGDTATGRFFIDTGVEARFFGGRAPFIFQQDEDWVFEAGVVDQPGGVLLSLKVWKPGDPIPAAPQLTWFDATPLPPNVFQLGTWVPRGGSKTSATFDDVYFRGVPEPSTLGLLGLAAAIGLRRTSRRRLPSVR